MEDHSIRCSTHSIVHYQSKIVLACGSKGFSSCNMALSIFFIRGLGLLTDLKTSHG